MVHLNFSKYCMKILKCQFGNITIHIKTNDTKIIEYRVDLSNETAEGKIELTSLTKEMPYIMDLTFYTPNPPTKIFSTKRSRG